MGDIAVTEAGTDILPSRTGVATPRTSMVPYYAYRAAESLVRVLPRRTAYWLGDRAADALLLAVPKKFDSLRENLGHVVPGAGTRQLDRLVRRNVRNLTHCWVDVMEMSSSRTDLPSRLDIDDLHNYTDALERGHGVVVASIHYGSWEAGLAGWNAMGGSLALFAEVLHPQKLFERVTGARGQQRVHVIPIDVAAMRHGDPRVARRLGAAAMREVFRVLRSGGSVAVALDRDLTGNGEPMEFFGAPAPIPIGAVDIAIRAGSAIVPVVLHRDDKRIHAVTYPPVEYSSEAPREAEVRRAARVVLGIFETAIRQHPDQWHVLDPIWTAAPR